MRFRKLAIVVGVFLLLLIGGWFGTRRWLEQAVADKLHARLAGTDFDLRWQSLALGPTGQLTLRQLVLHDAVSQTDVLTAGEIDANVAVWPSFVGQKRLDSLRLADVHLRVDLADGQADALERLRKALKKRKDDLETGERTPLLARLGAVDVEALTVAVQISRHGELLLKTAATLQGHARLADPASELTAQLDATLGGGKVVLALEHAEGELTAVRAASHPPVRVALQALYPKAPPNWQVAVRALALEKAGPNWQVVLADVGLGPVEDTALTIAEVRVHADKSLAIRDVQLSVKPAMQAQLLPEKVRQQLADVGLSGEWTATVATLTVQPGADDALAVDAGNLALGIAGLEARLQRLQLALADRHALRDPASWRTIELDAPTLSLPIDGQLLQKDENLAAEIGRLASLRKPADEPEEEDATDENVDPDALPETPPEDDPTKPPTAAQRSKEKPGVRWTRSVNNLHARLLGLHDKLDDLWPNTPLPASLTIQVRGGRLELTDKAGKALLGLRDGRVELLPPEQGMRKLSFGAEPFDSAGSWGHMGATWQHAATGHRLDIRMSGAGIAQLLAIKAKGLAVQSQADIELLATLALPDDDRVDVSGRLSVTHMGVHWWRLAERPIADLRLNMPFELHVRRHPASIQFRSPDVFFGGAGDDAMAHMAVDLDIAAADTKPRVHFALEAPVQESADMLHAIPPSMLPTIGRIDAHGPLGWRVAVTVPLAMTGAAQVELALGDTNCVMDNFGNILLEELNEDFDRPVNENGTILDDVHIGPASGSWTPLTEIPAHAVYSIWATEDSFFRHRGISESLVSKALAIDLSYGRFIYGGSTITQQLVKNLYLLRQKALSRKFEEMLIAWQMEKVVGKQRILEIYINGVEFGPKIYGITRAAWAFFGKTPGELIPKEGVYLGIIKPSPRSGYGTARANGWGDWYDMKVTKYMDRLLDEDFISPEEYEAEKPFKPNFNVQSGKSQ